MTEKLYTQEEVDKLQREWESDLFENKTNAALSEITKRLDQSNGYKETIGKDVLEVKNDVKELRVKVLELENARLKDQQASRDAEAQKYTRSQDKQARYVGYASIALWATSILVQTGIAGHIVSALLGR